MRSFFAGVGMTAVVVSVAAAAGYTNVTSREAETFMEKSRNVVLLDVRTPEEFRQGRLKGAILIPVSDLERRVGEVPKNRPVVVYCAVGSRSAAAAGFLASKGYRDVFNMSDGIVGWYRHGFPVER